MEEYIDDNKALIDEENYKIQSAKQILNEAEGIKKDLEKDLKGKRSEENERIKDIHNKKTQMAKVLMVATKFVNVDLSRGARERSTSRTRTIKKN